MLDYGSWVNEDAVIKTIHSECYSPLLELPVLWHPELSLHVFPSPFNLHPDCFQLELHCDCVSLLHRLPFGKSSAIIELTIMESIPHSIPILLISYFQSHPPCHPPDGEFEDITRMDGHEWANINQTIMFVDELPLVIAVSLWIFPSPYVLIDCECDHPVVLFFFILSMLQSTYFLIFSSCSLRARTLFW